MLIICLRVTGRSPDRPDRPDGPDGPTTVGPDGSAGCRTADGPVPDGPDGPDGPASTLTSSSSPDLEYRRPWEFSSVAPADTFQVTVTVKASKPSRGSSMREQEDEHPQPWTTNGTPNPGDRATRISRKRREEKGKAPETGTWGS